MPNYSRLDEVLGKDAKLWPTHCLVQYPCEKVDGVNLEEAEEVAHLDTWFFPIEVFESSASVLKTENESLFLEVNFMDSFIMPIESVQEAEAILKKIWN